MFQQAVPLLRMTDSRTAESFYCGLLGFHLVFADRPAEDLPDPCYMGLERDNVSVHLSSHEGDGVFGTAVNFWVNDVDALYTEFLARDVPIALAPTDQTWGTRELYVEDPDGNSLRFLAKRN